MRQRCAIVGLSGTALLLFGVAVLTVEHWWTGAHLYRNIGVSLAPGWYRCLPVPAEGLLPLGALVEIAPPAFAMEGVAAALSPEVAQLPWLKYVAVVAGATVCVHGPAVVVDEVVIAERPLLPRSPLAVIDACWTLAEDDVFVLGSHARSWDSRYVGPLPRAAVKGLCQALWTWEE